MLREENNRSSVKLREQRFITLYKTSFPTVASHISKMGGSFEEAKDVFQDALVIFYEKQQNGTLELKTSEPAYLFGVARHLWFRKYRNENKLISLPPHAEISDFDQSAPSKKKILRYLETAGQKCMELLKAFYYDHLQLEQIAQEFGFSGTRSATVQKFKCLEKVRNKIKEKSLVYEDFLE